MAHPKNPSVAAPKMCWRLKWANKTTTDKVLARSEEHCVHNKRPQEVRVTPEQREAGAGVGSKELLLLSYKTHFPTTLK